MKSALPHAIIICYVMLLIQQKGAYIPAKRKDNKGRTLRIGETQQPDGRYKVRYTNSFLYDSIQGIVETYNREELMKANLEKRQPVYLPKMSAHIFRHTFCTRMCEQNVNLKVLQDIMGHRNTRTTMEAHAKAARGKKRDAIQEPNGKFKIL